MELLTRRFSFTAYLMYSLILSFSSTTFPVADVSKNDDKLLVTLAESVQPSS